MFQSLRVNSPIYLFYKGNNPRIEIGYVNAQPTLKPLFPTNPSIGLQQNTTLDLVVKIGDRIENYNNIPSTLDVADCYYNGENVVIATTKDAMNEELNNTKQKSIDIINSVDRHKSVIITCDKLLSELNPEYAEKKKQQEEIDSIKVEMNKMSGTISKLIEMNSKLVEQLKNKENNI